MTTLLQLKHHLGAGEVIAGELSPVRPASPFNGTTPSAATCQVERFPHSVTYRAVSACPCRLPENTTRAFDASGACNLPTIMFGAAGSNGTVAVLLPSWTVARPCMFLVESDEPSSSLI